jgi:hypothetical protein
VKSASKQIIVASQPRGVSYTRVIFGV